MKIIFYLGHPAHYHLFKYPIKLLKVNNYEIIILIKKKDILEELLKNEGLDYINGAGLKFMREKAIWLFT